jgi:hypothetical protein
MQDHVFFDYRPQVTWLYPIWNALNATTSKTLREARSKCDLTALGDRAIAVATKLAILQRVVGRFNSDYEKLLKLAADDAERIQINRETGTVWSVANELLAYDLLADIDAFIFEARSTYEILGRFLGGFYKSIFNEILIEETLKAILRDGGLDVEWTALLRDERILFFHETAPWLALKFQNAESASHELLIVRGNVKTLDDPDSFARLADYNGIYSGLASALEKLQQHIVARIVSQDRAGP